jgi:hypothetical protein
VVENDAAERRKSNKIDKPYQVNENQANNFQNFQNFQQGNNETNDLQNYKDLIGLTYENLKQNIKEDVNQQIFRIKSEVNQYYAEMNEMFSKLRMDVTEASQLKFEAERELNKIKEEIERQKMTNLLYEDKLGFVLEKHAPYNNLHIPYEDAQQMQINTKMFPVNLKSTSTLVFNKDEINLEKQNKMSNLAKRGQNLMGDSEFVPIMSTKINTNTRSKLKLPEELDDLGLGQNLENSNNNQFFNYNEIHNASKQENVYEDSQLDALYSKVKDISDLNAKMLPI